jgi:NTE family protein
MSKWLVLSGGGSKGAFELGVVSKLKELDPSLEYDGFSGISVGALLSSMFSQGNLNDMVAFGQNLWFNIIKGNSSIWVQKLFKWLILSAVPVVLLLAATVTSFFANGPMCLTAILGTAWLASFILPYLVIMNVKSIYSSKPLHDLVYKYFDPAKTKAAGKKLIVGAVSWGKGTYESATEDNPNIRDWVLASSAYPLFLDNIKIEDLWYTDGGVRRVAPLQDAIDAGATEVDVVLASTLAIGSGAVMPPLTGQLMRTLDIYFYQIIRDNLIDVARLYPDVKIRVFMPDCSLTGDSLSFAPDSIRYMFEQGQRVALKPMTIQEANATVFGR